MVSDQSIESDHHWELCLNMSRLKTSLSALSSRHLRWQVLDLDAREAGNCPIGINGTYWMTTDDLCDCALGCPWALHEVGYCKAIEKILVPSDRSIILRTAGSLVCLV